MNRFWYEMFLFLSLCFLFSLFCFHYFRRNWRAKHDYILSIKAVRYDRLIDRDRDEEKIRVMKEQKTAKHECHWFIKSFRYDGLVDHDEEKENIIYEGAEKQQKKAWLPFACLSRLSAMMDWYFTMEMKRKDDLAMKE